MRRSALGLLLAGCADPAPAPTEPQEEETVPQGLVVFAFPVAEPERISATVGVDHDPESDDDSVLGAVLCTDYLGRPFPHCYGGHRGTDYMLEGGFAAMDDGSATAVAAAPGEVLEVVDGFYDRCRAQGTEIDCDGHPKGSNHVVLLHDHGVRTLYHHLMKDSIGVEVGDTVACGDPLGLLGSSGHSSAPHLHFEVWDPEGAIVDPYAGPYSQEETWWWDQGDPDGLPGATCGGAPGLTGGRRP